MLISKIQKKYKMTSTALNDLCHINKVYPVFLHTDYFIDKNAVVYKLDISNEAPKFIALTPFKYSTKHNIPYYKLKNDISNEYDKLRADIIYLSTFYGPMPKELIYYRDSFNWATRDMNEVYYHPFGIKYLDENNISIANIILKRIHNNIESSHSFISEYGTVYNETTNQFTHHYFNKKLYHMVTIRFGDYYYKGVHQLVYMMWINNGKEALPENTIDHIDGYKNHNWASNLREVSKLDNFRSAAYDQELRKTPWTYEIIHFVCKLMSDPNTSGISEMYNKTKSKFNDFEVSYSAFKHKIYEIKNGEFWRDVSSKYDVSAYDNNRSNHNNIAVSDELIHKICQIATNGIKYNSNKEMAEINNLPLGIVNRVLRGEYRTDISSQYNIQYSTKKRKSFTEEEIHSICQDFMDGYAVNKIVERRNRNKNDIWKIIRREKYSEIGKMYNFESIRPDLNYTVEYNSN